MLLFLLVLLITGSLLIPVRTRGVVLGIFIHFLLVTAGIFIAAFDHPPSKLNWLGYRYKPGDLLAGRIISDPVEKKNSWQAVMQVQWVIRQHQPRKSVGNMLLLIDQSSNPSLLAGRSILVKATPAVISFRANPGGFDFQQYQALKGIYHVCKVDPRSMLVLGHNPAFHSVEILARVRKNILEIIRQNIPGEVEKGLAEALLIGYREDLDRGLTQAYSNTGVIHVIAISGLHLGIVYWLLSILFRPLKRKKTGWLSPLLVVAGLWGFSLLCGGSPSVIRSAVMFSFICLGDVSGRKMSIYNSLAASAFLLCCFDPNWLWDTGFQLSYAAVLSMAIFMKPIYQWFEVQNPALDTIWKMLSGTLAAQILTTPVCLYYFHQFPLLFPVSNLLAIPLSSLILLLEILLLACSGWQAAAQLTGQVTSVLIQLLNSFIEWLNSYPFALWKGIVITLAQLCYLYGLICSLSVSFLLKKKTGLAFSFLFLILFAATRLQSFRHASRQQELIVLNTRGRQSVCLIAGRQCILSCSPELLQEPLLSTILRPMLTIKRVSKLVNRNLPSAGNLVWTINGTVILLARSQPDKSFDRWPEKTDILLLSNQSRINLPELLHVTHARRVVLDASVSARKTMFWEDQCRAAGVAVWVVSRQGAFVENLSSLTFAPRKTAFP